MLDTKKTHNQLEYKHCVFILSRYMKHRLASSAVHMVSGFCVMVSVPVRHVLV